MHFHCLQNGGETPYMGHKVIQNPTLPPPGVSFLCSPCTHAWVAAKALHGSILNSPCSLTASVTYCLAYNALLCIPTVLVSNCCYNELSQSYWLETTLIYSVIIWRPKIRHQSHCTKVKVSEDWFLLEALGKYPFPFHFRLLEITCISWLMAPSWHITPTSYFHSHISLLSNVPLPFFYKNT